MPVRAATLGDLLPLTRKGGGGAKPSVVLWDFGNTLVDERWAWGGPPGVPGWERLYRAFGGSELAEGWNTGRVSTDEVATHLARVAGCDVVTVESYLRACCRSITFFPAAWAAVARHQVPQALVTVNPDVFRSVIVPAYGLDQVFDVVVISAEEGTTDKVLLCEAALGRLGPDLGPAASLSIDNIAANVRRWRQRGGRGYVFTNDAQFARDLAAEQLAPLGAP